MDVRQKGDAVPAESGWYVGILDHELAHPHDILFHQEVDQAQADEQGDTTEHDFSNYASDLSFLLLHDE